MLNQPSISQEEVIAINIANVRARIVAAAERVGRNADEVTLVAVSKTKPLEMILSMHIVQGFVTLVRTGCRKS